MAYMNQEKKKVLAGLLKTAMLKYKDQKRRQVEQTLQHDSIKEIDDHI